MNGYDGNLKGRPGERHVRDSGPKASDFNPHGSRPVGGTSRERPYHIAPGKKVGHGLPYPEPEKVQSMRTGKHGPE